MNVLTVPASRRHGVYFYQRRDYLIQRIHDFVHEGLALGETTIVVAVEEHRQAVRRSLSRSPAIDEPTYFDVDAEEYLARFSDGGVLDKSRFLALVTPVLNEAQALGRPIRLYGEGVAVLWNQGFRQAAIELEQWWNELLRQYSFSTILCGYPSDAHAADDLVEILAAHTHACIGDAIQRL